MPKLFDEQGNEVEALSPEELENEIAQAVTSKENELKKTFESEKKALQDDIEKFKQKDLNFGTLRETKEKVEKQLKELQEKYEADVVKLKSEQMSEYKAALLKTIAGSDEDVLKKIEQEAGLLNMPETTKEEIEAKFRKAFQNATGGQSKNILNPIISSGGAGGGGSHAGVDMNLASLAKKMGMSETDYIKYYQKGVQDGLIK